MLLSGIWKDYVPFLRVFGLNGKNSRSSEDKNFKESKKINKLKKKVKGGPLKNF